MKICVAQTLLVKDPSFKEPCAAIVTRVVPLAERDEHDEGHGNDTNNGAVFVNVTMYPDLNGIVTKNNIPIYSSPEEGHKGGWGIYGWPKDSDRD